MFVSGIHYELGELESITLIPELAADPLLLASFKAAGLSTYSKMSGAPVEAVIRCIESTLRASARNAQDIDEIIFVSSTLLDSIDLSFRRSLFTALPCYRAQLTGLTLAECANLATALEYAEAQARMQPNRLALVVLADVIERGRSRIVDPRLSVYSDCVCTFVVHSDLGEFEITSIAHASDQRAWLFDPSAKALDYMDCIAGGMKAIFARQKADIADSMLITNNYSIDMFRNVAFTLRTPFERVFTKNLGRVAHTYSADAMLGLSDLLRAGQLTAGSKAFLLVSGVGHWGGIAVRAKG